MVLRRCRDAGWCGPSIDAPQLVMSGFESWAALYVSLPAAHGDVVGEPGPSNGAEMRQYSGLAPHILTMSRCFGCEWVDLGFSARVVGKGSQQREPSGTSSATRGSHLGCYAAHNYILYKLHNFCMESSQCGRSAAASYRTWSISLDRLRVGVLVWRCRGCLVTLRRCWLCQSRCLHYSQPFARHRSGIRVHLRILLQSRLMATACPSVVDRGPVVAVAVPSQQLWVDAEAE